MEQVRHTLWNLWNRVLGGYRRLRGDWADKQRADHLFSSRLGFLSFTASIALDDIQLKSTYYAGLNALRMTTADRTWFAPFGSVRGNSSSVNS